ncbi:MAG: tRNA1(Val) (adenine(37)-N6)-methyltransferase [Treponema sp.]|uniref:tRNA1(Val) (adenine(37)-N6)-methyltransferase n=1 Tax=Treponema sp. TaxID=166 RepID=UPI00298E97E5|nr:tRNA1(Val) (adenine(37)-N6)-methyltransferase [Treponema sp.]MBR5933831.1 tRNA1(Val) (adenine(37)-N6)-methyltransferase [Treponema sp.]
MKCNKNHGYGTGACADGNDKFRTDGFPAVNLKIMQDKKAFCFGLDAVLLSDFTVVKKNECAVDLGTGSGIIPLILSRTSASVKNETDKFTALEIQKEQAELAKKNVALNNLEDKIKVVEGDIKNVKKLFKPQSFDVVTSNPPYAVFTGGAVSGDAAASGCEKSNCTVSAKAIARQEILCTLEDVVKAASYILKPKGRFYMIHRPERLEEIFISLNKFNLKAKRMKIVMPFIDSAPTMVLIEAVKDAKCGVKLEKPLIVYKEKGQYSEEVSALYKKLSG